MAKTYKLKFEGYCVVKKWGLLPSESGIYCVYAATLSARRLSGGGKKQKALRLLYIGEAKDIRKRVPQNPTKRREKWKKKLMVEEILCVSFARIAEDEDRMRAEAAMIYKHQPPCNTEYTDSFPFCRTTIKTSGKKAGLEEKFTVDRVE